MSTGSRESRPGKRHRRSTLVAQIYAEVTTLARATSAPTTDQRMNQLCNALQAATAKLAQAPALSPAEIMAKLSILCARLRETLHLDAGDELVTYLLAESVREDCRLMADADSQGDLQ